MNHLRLTLGALAWLFLSSLVFYGWWNWEHLPLFATSIIFNFTCSRLILLCRDQHSREDRARWLLGFGILMNLILLSYYKYSNFFLQTGAEIFGYSFTPQEIPLPLAVSFFTIQQIVFLVDTFEGLCPNVSALRYAVYVSFFPHLIAGPIVLHNELIPQLSRTRSKIFNPALGVQGLLILSIGLIKKVLIADTLSVWANRGFDGFGSISFCEAWTSSIAYSLQLYFDFSGYSDMAVGAALLFNLKLPINFRSPYRASNLITFWQNWHITLSRFITSYLYVPILRLFLSITFASAMFATLAAMLIAGLWHGADWRFIVFGGMHGIGLVINHIWRRKKYSMPRYLGWAITFFWVNLSFVVFRSSNLASVLRMLHGMFSPSSFGEFDWQVLSAISASFAIVFIAPNTERILGFIKHDWLKWAVISGAALAFSLGTLEFQKANEFLYFKF
jgi:D-alanyl-lipoteichoic acid acyltransferase DltB (MBOAT superfamily)